MYLGFDRLYFF